jgi:hypothetical protein
MKNTFNILDKTRSVTFKKHNGALVYTGIVYMEHGIDTKEDFLNALDANNFGGTVDFRKTDKANIFSFYAVVYID